MPDSDTKKEAQTGSDTILFMLYILFKANLITRHNLRDLLAAIKKGPPEDAAKFLVAEVSRL